MSVGLAYGWGLVSVMLATLARLGLNTVLDPYSVPFITFFPAIVAAAWVGGLGPGLMSVLLSTMVASYLFISPAPSPSMFHAAEISSLILFVMGGMGISAMGEAQHRTRKRLEQVAHDAETRRALLLTTLRSIGDAVIVTDTEGNITLMNPQAERLTGWTEKDAMGQSCATVFAITNESTGAVVESPVDKVRRLGGIVGLANHTVLTARDGTISPIDDSGAPINDPAGELQGIVLVFRDITERREQERALETNEAQLRAILDNAPSVIFLKDRDGRYTLVNHAFTQLHGLPYEECIGKTDQDLFLPEFSAPIQADDHRVWETGTPLQIEESSPFPDKPLTFLTIKFPLRDASGEMYALGGVSTDITARKQEEVARQFLTESSAVLASSLDYEQTLQQVAHLAVPEIADWCSVDMWDPQTREIQQLAVAHVDPEKVKWALELRDTYPPEPDGATGLPNVLRTGKSELYPYIPEEALVAGARDEQHLAVMRQIGFRSVLIVPIVARERTLGAITLVTTNESGHSYTEADLTLAEGLAARAALAIDNARLYRVAQRELAERQRIEDALRASEEQFRFALANSDIGVYSQDSELRYTWVYSGSQNRALTEIYGKTDAEIMAPDEAVHLMEIKRRVYTTGVEERHVVQASRVEGQPRFYDTVFKPQRDADGKIIGVTGTVTDITERKQGQDALTRHQAEIEALNVRLHRSMRETHHRVKNNLQVITALIGMQQLKHEESVPTAELERLTQHIQSLASIHDLLTQQARTDKDVVSVSIRAVMEKLKPGLQLMAGERGITFYVADLHLPVRHSTTVAVLVNELISNSLKHGKGQIEVGLAVQGPIASLEVRDSGPGFPEDFNAETAANTGLDLISSLTLIDLNGTVRYETREEGGARVVITFPIPAVGTV
ncbi:MAG: PAS domain-containing protein [Armatimonas sp.]